MSILTIKYDTGRLFYLFQFDVIANLETWLQSNKLCSGVSLLSSFISAEQVSSLGYLYKTKILCSCETGTRNGTISILRHVLLCSYHYIKFHFKQADWIRFKKTQESVVPLKT